MSFSTDAILASIYDSFAEASAYAAVKSLTFFWHLSIASAHASCFLDS
jgi:hypothetical protein